MQTIECDVQSRRHRGLISGLLVLAALAAPRPTWAQG